MVYYEIGNTKIRYMTFCFRKSSLVAYDDGSYEKKKKKKSI